MQFSLPLKCPFIKGVGWVSVPQLGRRNFFNLRDRLIIAYSLCENDKCSNILIYVQQDATPHSLFYLETALHVLRWYHHPSSGAQTTVSTASGIGHTAIVEELELGFQFFHDSGR